MIRSLLLFPVNPRGAARSIQVRPTWWPAVAVLAALTVLTEIIEWPSVIDGVLAHLPSSASEADREWVRSVLANELSLRCLVTPFIAAGIVMLFSGLLHYLGRAQRFVQRPRYPQLIALVAYAACIPVVVDLLTVCFGAWSGRGASAPSLAWFAGSWGVNDFVLVALLQAVGLAAVWFTVTLAAGLSVLFACSFRRSLLFAVTAWAMAVLANLWLLRIMVETLHLRV